MSKLFVLIGILMLASASARAGMFTNTGTASETCIWDGSGAPVPPDVSAISVTGTGASINLICPASFYGPSAGSYFGPGVSGSAGNLTAQGLIGEVPHVNATFSFQSNFTDSLTPVGGTGPGTVEFTVTYTWGGF